MCITPWVSENVGTLIYSRMIMVPLLRVTGTCIYLTFSGFLTRGDSSSDGPVLEQELPYFRIRWICFGKGNSFFTPYFSKCFFLCVHISPLDMQRFLIFSYHCKFQTALPYNRKMPTKDTFILVYTVYKLVKLVLSLKRPQKGRLKSGLLIMVVS